MCLSANCGDRLHGAVLGSKITDVRTAAGAMAPGIGWAGVGIGFFGFLCLPRPSYVDLRSPAGAGPSRRRSGKTLWPR